MSIIEIIEETDRAAKREAAWSEYCSLQDRIAQMRESDPVYHVLCAGRDAALATFSAL